MEDLLDLFVLYKKMEKSKLSFRELETMLFQVEVALSNGLLTYISGG